jgi:signal transduction histidine kinase
LYRLLDDLETMFFPMADDKQLRLVFECSPEVPQYVRADEVKLRQVLTNLLNSALESTSQGVVLIRTDTVVHSHQGSTDLRLSFTIEDTGPGMAAQDLKELSDSSVPGWAGRRVPENSDLALAISIRYVQLLGGTLNIESQVGHGTTVAFEIPVEPIGPDRDVAHADQN